MNNPTFVRDELSKDFIILDPEQTVAQATDELNQEKATVGIVNDPVAGFPGLVTKRLLKRSANKQEKLASLIASLPRPSPVRADDKLAPIVEVLAHELITDRSLAGLVVWDEQQQVIGVVPRKRLARVAAGMIERGGDSSRLEGASILTGAYFYCPQDGEEKLVSYYNPANPPKCKNGHLMKRKRRSR